MIMNEIEHGKWIMRVGRDTIDLSWIVVVIQSEASVFLFEAFLIGWLLKTFCSRVQYSIYHSDFPIEGRVRPDQFNRYWQILENSSRNFAVISVFRSVTQTDIWKTHPVFFVNTYSAF